jgi:beta-carotene hydroxylase
MTPIADSSRPDDFPTLHELGDDLLRVTSLRRFVTLTLPFLWMACYTVFACLRIWPLAVVSVMALSFTTYGSTSHDLVHRTLRLPHRLNDRLLSLIELLSLRSGTAYRLSHLHHHRQLLSSDDLEGSSAHGSLWRAIVTGPTMQLRLWHWAWKARPEQRRTLLFEAIGILILIVAAVVTYAWSAVPLVYVALVVAGSWVFPVVTVYLPHDARGETPLTRTRLFRGPLMRLIAFDHLYHLEHHLYPAVPHHNWKFLADRLNPHFARAGVLPNSTLLRHGLPTVPLRRPQGLRFRNWRPAVVRVERSGDHSTTAVGGNEAWDAS